MRIRFRPGRRSKETKAARRPRSRGLSLEVLEDRYLLSTAFTQINLDSDIPGLARVTDPNLVNPWGISFSPTGGFWFGDNGTWVSDVVDGTGTLLPVVVTIHGTGGGIGFPTGTVYNGGPGFQIQKNGVSEPAHFLFASQDGTISAWNSKVDAANALLVIDNSAQGADYTGMALATGSDGKSYLYGADFGRGEIDVFDQNFQQVSLAGSFTDPNIPAGFAPYNVQNINGQLFVTYAKQKPGSWDEVDGAGYGFVDIFSASGELVERLASGGPLDAPWGLAVAPQSFGPFAGALLVGNRGDGHISAYQLQSGAYLGQLTDSAGNPIAIDGLWGLTVGNDHLAGNSQTVYFAAGIHDEQDGLFGAIQNIAAGRTSTAGTLPYDPNSNDDDYPLPPARGPSLGSESGPPAPTPVLLPMSNSSFALAPTLSISSALSEGNTLSSSAPALSSTDPASTLDSANSGVIMGTITGPGTPTAFSLTSPLKLTSSNRSTQEDREIAGSNVSSNELPLSLRFLDLDVPPASAENEEPTFFLSFIEADRPRPRPASRSSNWESVSPDSIENDIRIKSIVEPIVSLSAEKGPVQEVDLAAIFEPLTLLERRLIQGSLLLVAAFLPWNPYGVRNSPASKNLPAEEFDDDRAPFAAI